MDKTDPKVLVQMCLMLYEEITNTIKELERLKEKLIKIQFEVNDIFMESRGK